MPTISLSRSETRSIAISAPPQAVFAFIAQPRNLPRWAPGFAAAVREDPEHADRCLVTGSDGTEFPIVVRTSEAHGTVDLLGGPELNIGAFSRVLPNATGAEYLFTLFFPEGTPEDAITAQMEVVDGELRTVREFAEAT